MFVIEDIKVKKGSRNILHCRKGIPERKFEKKNLFLKWKQSYGMDMYKLNYIIYS